jgi:hypothetical protein
MIEFYNYLIFLLGILQKPKFTNKQNEYSPSCIDARWESRKYLHLYRWIDSQISKVKEVNPFPFNVLKYYDFKMKLDQTNGYAHTCLETNCSARLLNLRSRSFSRCTEVNPKKTVSGKM